MTAPEFSRPIALDTLGETPRVIRIEADPAERAALARRFSLVQIDALAAELALRREEDRIFAEGRVTGAVTQSCIASGAPVLARIDEAFSLEFRPLPAGERPDEEVELGESELDVTFYEGGAIDIGEAAAETLALALDLYPRAPDADAALKASGVKSEAETGPASPFAALAALKGKLKP
jgi:uncharacterized metal-binding protein YceD (DUF177 family)